jgi:acetyl-CoA C-acetyltransferase
MALTAVVIVDGVRTPIGKYGGALGGVRPDDLAAHVLGRLLERTGMDPGSIDDVFWGAANQAGEDNRNVARMAALLAGLPVEVGGATVNRLCGSGLQAVVSAAREIQVGACEIVMAGGEESMTRAPLVLPKADTAFARGNRTMYDTTLGWRMVNPRMEDLYPTVSLGQTAENVADRYGVSREDQDAWALRSHQKAIAAQESCRFSDEIVPIDVPAGRGQTATVERDEGPRPDTSADKLAKLRPAFAANGTVTAGNSSQLNDGAAALLLMSAERARDLGLRPLVRFVDAASAGVDPAYMGIGPVPATQKLLRRSGLAVEDLDVVELNEAFASQVLACIRELGLDPERVNPNGGAIALGHPLGASGARLAVSVAHEMARRKLHFGLATMCIGVGQGISALFAGTEG